MARVRVLLYVMIHAGNAQRAFQPLRRSAERAIFGAKTSDDGTRLGQQLVGIVRHGAIVHAGCCETMVRRKQQREAASHAKTDHSDATAAAVLVRKPGAHGLYLFKGSPASRPHIAKNRSQAFHLSAPIKEVRRGGQES